MITFTKNLNPKLRDDYKINSDSKRSSSKKVSVVRIQGDKTGLEGRKKQKPVLPMIKISRRLILDRVQVILKAFLVWEICEKGVRTFYHHSTHEFTEVSNKKVNNLNQTCSNIPYRNTDTSNIVSKTSVVIPHTETMLEEEGDEIELCVKAVLGAKIYSKKEQNFFCKLEDQYREDTDYETTRIIIIPECDGKLLWEDLILSNSTIFCKSNTGIDRIEVLDSSNKIIEHISVLKKQPKIQKRKTMSECNSPEPKRLKASDNENQAMLPMTLTINDDQERIKEIERYLLDGMPSSSSAVSNLNDTHISAITNTDLIKSLVCDDKALECAFLPLSAGSDWLERFSLFTYNEIQETLDKCLLRQDIQ